MKVIHRSDYNYSEVADVIKDNISVFFRYVDTEIKVIRKRAADIAEKGFVEAFH